MTVVCGILAALSILPSDRLAMADRLFNRGEYAAADVEYRALEGEKSIASDELLYRRAECARATGNTKESATLYESLANKFPDSAHTDNARLQLALAKSGEARLNALSALDTDRVRASVRAAALYHLGVEKGDPEILRKCVKVEPKGRYAVYADCRRGTMLTSSSDPAVRRKGMEILLGIGYGKSALADDALFLAASVSYREKKYGEAGSLFRRYRKRFPKGSHFDESSTLSVWCDYSEGRYADAAAACGDGKTDDFAYVRACCAAETEGGDLARKLFKGYLDDFPSGRYRREAELQLARLDFSAAVSANEISNLIEAARRAAKSGNATDALRLGWAYEKASRVSEAEAEYAKIVREFPASPESAQAMYALAMISARADDWAKAELRLAEALSGDRLGAKRASALYWRGVAAMRLKHENEGVGFLNEALKLGLGLDESREARLMIAAHDLESGRVDTAKAAYAKLVRDGACARMNAARIFQLGGLLGGEEAKICAKALAESSAAEWRQAGWTMLGQMEESESSYTSAIAAYRKALSEPAKTESAAVAALALGKLELRAGEHPAAKRTLENAVTLNAGRPSARGAAYLALAENAIRMNDIRAARGYATVVTALFSDTNLVAAAEKILKDLPQTK